MNKKNIIIAAVCALALSAGPAAASSDFSAVVNPEVPMKVEFAGQKFDIDDVERAERLDRELTAMSYTHGTTLLTIKRANRYWPLIVPILEANGVPRDLFYLACIESSLNPRALSPSKAAGLWQFMPDTGREYGLEVNEWVDERYHPVKATEAACRYLKDAYGKYGSWESVAASYNGGMGRISSELSKQGVNSAFDLFLAEETMRYPFRLLAMKLIMEHPRSYGFRLNASQLYQPFDYEEVEVSEQVDDWGLWALDHGTTYLQVRTHNPWIRSRSLPNKQGRTYIVVIPKAGSLKRSAQDHKVYINK